METGKEERGPRGPAAGQWGVSVSWARSFVREDEKVLEMGDADDNTTTECA